LQLFLLQFIPLLIATEYLGYLITSYLYLYSIERMQSHCIIVLTLKYDYLHHRARDLTSLTAYC